MSEVDQYLTPEGILLFLLLIITLGMWLQLALLRNRLSSRLSRLEERIHEHDQFLELQEVLLVLLQAILMLVMVQCLM